MASQTTPTAGEGSWPAYKGSCHCGFVTYTCTLNLSEPHPDTKAILTRCNCSMCLKSGTLLATPQELTMLTPPDAEEGMSKYGFATGQVQHTFCPTCGIRCFFRGTFTLPDGGKTEYCRVNVLTLDERADGKPVDDLRSVEVMYFDGKSSDWSKPMLTKPYEGGVW